MNKQNESTNEPTKWTDKKLQELHYFFQIVFLKSAKVLQITN